MKHYSIGRAIPLLLIGTGLFGTGYTAGVSPEELRVVTPLPAVPSRVVETRPQQKVFGHSVNGEPLNAFVFGTGPNVTLIMGGIHGDEPGAAGVVELLRQDLEQHPEAYTGCCVVLVPRCNPDGLLARTRTNERGVDLNRNFPFEWKERGRAVRYSTGSGPASEPETRALMHLMILYHPLKVISVHQPLDCMTWCGPGSRTLAEGMQRWNHYPIPDSIGYPTPGSFGKYCGKGMRIAEVTLELPAVSAARAWNQNRHALFAAIRFGS
ncbi:MAG: DUF2817 domain-containing protein [Armatimonadota bacterium]|nr:DUF2817 domain-containing protein [Armatimonadota bacterium]